MGLRFGPQRTFTGSNLFSWISNGSTLWRAYWDSGTGFIKVDTCAGQGYGTPSTVTVDANGNDTSVPLNEPFCLDPVTGRLHLLFGRNEDLNLTNAVLLHSSSGDNGATWSATPHTLDDGSLHDPGVGLRFYRVGIVAYNGFVTVVYTSDSQVTFTQDGLWEVHSADAGATWSAPAKLYASPVNPAEPNIALGPDATVHLSWYDPGVVANQGGDVYYARAAYTGAGFTWAVSPTRLTTGEVWGRVRLATSNGIVFVVGNINWGGSVADVGYKRSTDNGATWSATATIATHGAGPLDHPWGDIDSERAALIWTNLSTNPLTYSVVLSTDAGATWSTPITPMTTSGSSGAPKLVLTDDLVIAVDVSGSFVWAVYPLFAPDPQVTANIDSFNRANEDPLSDGGTWTLNTDSANNLRIVSDAATRHLGAGSFDRSGDYRNDLAFTGSAELYGSVITAGGELCLYLWDPSTKNGYWLSISNGDFGTGASLDRFDGGADTTVINDAVTALGAGDRYVLRLDLKDIVAVRLASGDVNWQEILRAASTTYRTSLRPTLGIAGQAGTPSVANFGGGLLFPPVNTAVPTISGTVGNGHTLAATDGVWATDLGKTPTRFRFQWQQSLDGGATWANLTLATLRFFTIGIASGQYRVQVTGYNSLGSATVVSAAQSAPTGGGGRHHPITLDLPELGSNAPGSVLLGGGGLT